MRKNPIYIKIKLIWVLIPLVVLFSCLERQNAGEEEDLKKELSNGQSKQIDIVHQKINLKFDWETKQAVGYTMISLKNLSRSDTLLLDAGMLEITNVKLQDGKTLEFDYSGQNEDDDLKIILSGIKEKGKEISIRIDYSTNWVNQSDPNNIWGSFGKGLRFFEPSKTEKERRKQIWAVGEPVSNRYWFPSNHEPNDLRTTELIVNVPDSLKAFSNGDLISKNITDEETLSYHYKEDIPHPPHLTFVAVGEYNNYQQSYQDITINNYGYPDEKTGTEESVVRLPDMMKYYSEYTGQEYPYEDYSQIFIQDFGGWKGGVGHSLITENMIDDKTTHEDFLYGWDLTEGEALAYQWFGSYIKPASWNDVWLTKAFTRYFSGLYNQHKNGNTEFLTYQLSPDQSAYLNDWNSGLRTIVVPDSIEDVEGFVNGNAPYAKGAKVLHMLRNELGENKWKGLIKTYVLKYGGKLVRTSDFIELVNEISEQSMDWFFTQWVYGVGHPIFEVSQQYDFKTKQLEFTVLQKQQVDSLIRGRKIPFFRGKMMLEIDDNIKEISIGAKKKNVFTFSMEHEPFLINFDYEDTWIKESSFEKSTETLLYELIQSTDALHRVSVMQKLTTVATDSSTNKIDVSKIKKSIRNVALDEDYWRMRLIAVGQLSQILSASMYEGKIAMDSETEEMLLTLIDREKSWTKAWAINFLGMSRDQKYVPFYLEGLKDYSDRVVFMSAIALGKSKDSTAFKALMKLPSKPSWKNQSLISALYGLKELEDPRAYDLALKSLVCSDNPHWNLGTPVWDHRLAAAHTLVAIGRVENANELVLSLFKGACEENNVNDMFYNALQISILGHPKGKEVFRILKEKFIGKSDTLKAIDQLENNYLSNIKS